MLRPRVLTIAGSDPSGGAGLQADLSVFAVFGCHGMAVPAALTCQDSAGVRHSVALDAAEILDEANLVFEDSPPAAVKTGMLLRADAVDAVVHVVVRHAVVPLVVDPVLLSSSGARLFDDDARDALVSRLFPRATLVTPNAFEAAALTGMEVRSTDEATEAARRLLELGAGAALVKGGHIEGEDVADVLVLANGAPQIHRHERVRLARPVRGTGCALSAAIASGLARGLPLPAAVEVGVRYVQAAIRHAYPTGRGAFSLDRGVHVEGMNS